MLSPTGKPSFTAEEKAYIEGLLLALEPFLEIRHTMPLQYVTSFLRVALEEGEGVTEYAKKADVSKTVMTRHLLDIGERDREGHEGFGLVLQKRDPQDLRINRTYVAPKGAAKMRKAISALRLLCKDTKGL